MRPIGIYAFLIAVILFLAGGIFSIPAEEVPPTGQAEDELYRELAAGIEQAEALVAGIALTDGAMITGEQIEALELLNRQIRGSLYSDLIARSDLLLLLSREQVRTSQSPDQLQHRLEHMLEDSRQETLILARERSRDKVLRASLITSLASFALAFTFWGLGELQDQLYFQADTTEEARLHRRLFQVFTAGSMIGAAVGTVSAGVSVTFYLRGD